VGWGWAGCRVGVGGAVSMGLQCCLPGLDDLGRDTAPGVGAGGGVRGGWGSAVGGVGVAPAEASGGFL